MNKLALLPAVVLLLVTSVAAGQAPVLTTLGGPQGFGTECLHANDDQSSDRIDLTPAFPSGLRFFTDTHTSVYVNTNGNLTFSGALSTYTPRAFPVADRPMIAPFWADIDTRPPDACSNAARGCREPSENGIWWALEPGRMIVTWDDVGYFRCHDDKRMRFQLILTAVPTCGAGATDFDVEFRYNVCEWETGDASDGSGGFGGTEAQAGFDAGNGTDFIALPGSREAGISASLCTGSNIGDPGVWRFQIRSGAVVCPDAGEACSTGQPGVCAEGVTQCVGTGTECQPVVASSAEVCDALDNDCDGTVDEGDDICPGSGEICDRGRCVESCFEGGCPEGQACSGDGQCLDIGCEGVSCEDGERCVAGSCQAACDGVVCPMGQSCRGGLCLDLCEDIACDPSCSACLDGTCVPRCDLEGGACAAGETCSDEGLCVATSCLGVTCPDAGDVCVADVGCVDACEGATCPNGESCVDGACQRRGGVPVDAGPGVTEDGGAMADGGGMPADASFADAGPGGIDAGRIPGEPPPPPRGTDCLCSTPGAQRAGVGGLWLLPLAAMLMFVRRRR